MHMHYQTVASYLEHWLSTRARYSLRPRTHEGYRIVVRKHLAPTLGHLGLRDLTAAHVDALIWSKIDEGLSPRSAQYIHAVLRSALSDAERLGLIDTNVAKQVRPVRYDPKQPHPLRAEEVRALLVQVRGDRLESLFVLAVCTGMRLGEILALRCGEVALAEGTVAVTGTLQRYDGRLRRLPPKSASSRRTIALSPAAQASLRAHCERKSDEALRDRAFLFTPTPGLLWTPGMCCASSTGTWRRRPSPAGAFTICATPSRPSCWRPTCTTES